MPKMSRKATISMRGNSNNLPDLFFKELVQLYVKDCRRRGVEKVTTDGYEYACRKFLEYIGEDVRCSELSQEMIDNHNVFLHRILLPDYCTLGQFVSQFGNYIKTSGYGFCVKKKEPIILG